MRCRGRLVLRVHFPQIDAVRIGLIAEAAGRSYPLFLSLIIGIA
jgi:hypothetical protein